MFEKATKKIAGLIPGTGANIAMQKRAIERRLRAEGFSRTHAAAIVAERFKQSTLQSQ